jgi:DNA (cytosine-5)-methyltransferase 1
MREFALLQGFPMDHPISETSTLKQIGNAYPGVVAAVQFRWIKQALEKADRIVDAVIEVD